jgi:hypothetical protein
VVLGLSNSLCLSLGNNTSEGLTLLASIPAVILGLSGWLSGLDGSLNLWSI